jgi:D-alanine-D-alanine ligase
MKKHLRVTVLLDAGCIPGDDPQFEKLPGEPTTEYHVIQALRCNGHTVSILGIFDQVEPIVTALTDPKPDIVFNLTETFRNERHHDKHIAGLLEMLGIPYTGTGPAGLMVCRNKALSKLVLSGENIPAPGFCVYPVNMPIQPPLSLKYPLVVKPLMGDGSEGIANASLVTTDQELIDRTTFIHTTFAQSAIAEEFIEGRELYISVVGNARLTVLPPREFHYGNGEDNGPVLATYRVKWNETYQHKWKLSFGFGDVTKSTARKIARHCKAAYRILRINDYGRFDIRLTSENKVYILEANPNPDIAKGEDVAESAEKAGISYETLIEKIVRSALRRYRK